MRIKNDRGRFLFQNMFAHDPCHDFSPTGGGKRMHKLNARFKEVSTYFAAPTRGGGTINVQTGGAELSLKRDEADAAGDYAAINDGELIQEYSGFAKGGTIDTVTTTLINKSILDAFKLKLESTITVDDMSKIFKKIIPKDDRNQLISITVDTAINAAAGVFTGTRSAVVLRRKYINFMQLVVEMVEYIRLIVIMNNEVIDKPADTRDIKLKPTLGGRQPPIKKTKIKTAPPPAPVQKQAQEQGTLALAPLPEPVLAPEQALLTELQALQPPAQEQVLAPEIARETGTQAPVALPPTGNRYANMYLILDHLYNTYEDAKSSLAENDEVAELSESLEDMKNVIKFYKFAFEYYTTYIENMSSMYSINNSDFIKDVMFYYFIDLYSNRYFSDTPNPSKLMSDDDGASYRNSVFEIIKLLRQPIREKMDGGTIGNIMSGGTKEDYDEAVAAVNSISLVTCSLNDLEYTITWSNPAVMQKFQVTTSDDKVKATLTSINDNTKLHLNNVVSSLPASVTDAIKTEINSKIEAAFNKDDSKSLWNKQHNGQLYRFLIRGAAQRSGDKAIQTQLNCLITDVKSQMLNILRHNSAAISSAGAEPTSGALSADAVGVANGFLKQLCTTIKTKTPPIEVAGNKLFVKQDEIINRIELTGPYTNLDADLLNAFLDQHGLNDKPRDSAAALKQSSSVITRNFIDNKVLVKTLAKGVTQTGREVHRTVNIINNALMSTIADGSSKYVDYLATNFDGLKNTEAGMKNIKFQNMCPATCVLDAMGTFGSCSNGSGSAQYTSLKKPTQIFIETENRNFEFNMTTRHKNNVVIVEYYVIYNEFTVTNCVIEATVSTGPVNILSANNTFEEVLKYIEQNAPRDRSEMNWTTFFSIHSENIVRIISRKMIGDFGQEMTAVYPDGGYANMLGLAEIWGTGATDKSKIILKANGDRPSFVREAELLLAEPVQTNKNTVIMYLGGTDGVVVMSNPLQVYLSVQAGGAVQTKRKKRTTRNHKRTRKISARKTRRLNRNP